ncbi:MAG: hypothetical protein M3Y07_14140, partial [Acidobacteriota bacterium]|nr:hypothetical protein [Acidobacteriota bacterium]
MERCLAKDPSQRYDSTRNLYRNLRALRDHYSEAYASTAVEPLRNEARKHGGIWAWIAIPTCLLAAAAFGVLTTQKVGVDLSRNRYTPFAMMSEPQTRPLWSPDGKAVAWMGTVGGHGELFARYLNSPVATQLTHVDDAEIVRWSPDGKRVLFLATESNVGKAGPARGRYSIALIGGEPERLCSLPVEAFQIAAVDVSPDLKTMAIIARRGNGGRTVFLASPLGSEFREYQPDPFSSATFFGRPQLRFSPDGSKLLLVRTGDSPSEEAWLLTVPQGNPRRV